ncbi:hypothetical protein CN431_20110 [Bacillus cereus]|nr:hypothetical protein CN431_20110 [Bacillus cereus]
MIILTRIFNWLNTSFLNILKSVAITFILFLVLYYVKPNVYIAEILGIVTVMAFFLSISDYLSVLHTFHAKTESTSLWKMFWGVLIFSFNILAILTFFVGIFSLLSCFLNDGQLLFQIIVNEITLFSGLSTALFMLSIAAKEELLNKKKLNDGTISILILLLLVFIIFAIL